MVATETDSVEERMRCTHAGQPLLPVYDATEPIYPKSFNQIVPKPGQLARNGFRSRVGGEGGVRARDYGAG